MNEFEVWVVGPENIPYRYWDNAEEASASAEKYSDLNYFQVKLSTDIWEDEEIWPKIELDQQTGFDVVVNIYRFCNDCQEVEPVYVEENYLDTIIRRRPEQIYFISD